MKVLVARVSVSLTGLFRGNRIQCALANSAEPPDSAGVRHRLVSSPREQQSTSAYRHIAE
jgi:hypothetical protein